MGHYRSEMGYEDEDEKQRKHEEERITRRTVRFRELVEKHGLEEAIVRCLSDKYGVSHVLG